MRGRSYKFQANGISSSHPFYIFANGVNSPSISGSSGEINVTILSNHSISSGDLYYRCQIHSGMKGNMQLLYSQVSGTTNDGSYDFYYGDITTIVSCNFNQISVYCFYHGYMVKIWLYIKQILKITCNNEGDSITGDLGLQEEHQEI